MKSIQLISVPVTDQERSKEFYVKMGLKVEMEAPYNKDQKWIQLSFPGGGVTITLVTWFSKMPAGCLQGITIATDNIADDIAALNKNGIATGKVDETPWGKFASIADPDGNTWSLHQR